MIRTACVCVCELTMNCTFYISQLLGVTNLSCFLTYTNHLLPSEPWSSDDDGDSDDDDDDGGWDGVEVQSHQPPQKIAETYLGAGGGAIKRAAASMILNEADDDGSGNDDSGEGSDCQEMPVDSEEEEMTCRVKRRKKDKQMKKPTKR